MTGEVIYLPRRRFVKTPPARYSHPATHADGRPVAHGDRVIIKRPNGVELLGTVVRSDLQGPFHIAEHVYVVQADIGTRFIVRPDCIKPLPAPAPEPKP